MPRSYERCINLIPTNKYEYLQEKSSPSQDLSSPSRGYRQAGQLGPGFLVDQNIPAPDESVVVAENGGKGRHACYGAWHLRVKKGMKEFNHAHLERK